MRNEQMLGLPRLGIVYFWKIPLVSVGAWNAKIKEAFFGRFCNPVHSIIYFDLSPFADTFINTETYSLEFVFISTA